jgi:hypothetical protein
MDHGMNERKAFRHALATVGVAILLLAGFLFYLVGPHSELWPAFLMVILVPALILLPLVYRKYVNGPTPPLTRQQHINRFILQVLLSCVLAAGIFVDHPTGWRLVSQSCYSGGLLLGALGHLRRAYKSEGNLSQPQ